MPGRFSGWVEAALLAAALAAAPAAGAPAARPDTEAMLVAASGGVYRDPALTGYVKSVGDRLVAAAGEAPARWRFILLDTPETNAFALPGRRIYLTRGMLALADDEAELAVVLGHEIGHALAGDGLAPDSARARRATEVAADRTGLALLTRAGYDPRAQADFLGTLLASRKLEARLHGGPVEPPRWSDHPALADRLAAARQQARGGAGQGRRGREAYLAAIDGVTWGDGPAQGFMRGRSFLHPGLGFAFDAPPGYEVANLPDTVVATGPDGAMLLMDSVASPGGTPADYLARGWVPEIGPGVAAGPLEDLRGGRQNGLAVARGEISMTADGRRRVAELTVVRLRDRLYRLTAIHAPGDARAEAALAAASHSFRPLSRTDAARIPPLRLRVHRIAAGEDVAAMAAAMPAGPEARAYFDVINGLAGGGTLKVGDLVKVVGE